MEVEAAPEPLRPLLATIRTRVVEPLKAARDDVEWADVLDSVLEPWIDLRLELVAAIVELEGERVLDELVDAASELDEVPLTLLPEPAHGAARHAFAMLGGTFEGLVAAARHGADLDLRLLDALIADIAVIELAWLTIAGSERPAASVAEAAAWEAYSRVRPLRSLLARVGIDRAHLPAEDPAEAVARAAELLGRVARSWTPEERVAVEGSRLPSGAIQG